MSGDFQPGAETETSRSVAGAVGLTTLVTGVGYAITLGQQALFSRNLGVNAETDAIAAVLAWMVGITGFLGTALSTVYVPAYVRSLQAGAAQADATRRWSTRLALAAGGLLTATTLVGAEWIANLLVPGGSVDFHAELASLLRLGSPLGVIWLLYWLAVSGANAHERYVLVAATTGVAPLPVIAILLADVATAESVVAGYVVGTLLQLCLLWVYEPGSRPALGPSNGTAAASMSRNLVPAGAAFALLALIGLEVRGLASFSGAGAVATSDYASRLVLAGQQVLLSGVLAVTFTRWSRSHAAQDQRRADSVRRTVLTVGAIGVVTTIALPILAVDLVRVVLAGGRFSGADASAVGMFIAWMSPGVAAHMLLMVSLRALLAEGRYLPVVIAATAAVIVLPAVAVLTGPVLGLQSVAAGYSAGYLAAAAITVAAVLVTAKLTPAPLIAPAAKAASAIANPIGGKVR